MYIYISFNLIWLNTILDEDDYDEDNFSDENELRVYYMHTLIANYFVIFVLILFLQRREMKTIRLNNNNNNNNDDYDDDDDASL